MRIQPPHLQVAPQKVSTKVGEFQIEELPSFCPRCRRDALAAPLGIGCVSSNFEEIPHELTLEVPVRCPICHLAYVAEYDGIQVHFTADWELAFSTTVPNALPKTSVSATMKRISREFARVYDEAVAAQNAGLEELAGAGYRRALEFLVKDYLIYKNPEKRDIYVRTTLRNCIKGHIDEPSIQALADRAASIGNEFTHYEVFESRDIRELTSLIDLVHKWIDLHEEIDTVHKSLATGENNGEA